MFKAMRAVVFLLAWIPMAALAANRSVSETDLAAYKELAQTRLDAAKESLQKDREKTEARLDAQDKRIGDLNFTLTAFGALLTLLVLVAGLASWFSARDRAREEASEATKKWFEEKGKELEKEIEELRRRAKANHEESLNNIEMIRKEIAQHFQTAMDDVHERAEAAKAEIQNEIGKLSAMQAFGATPATVGKDGEALEKMEQVLRNKPEAEYGFDDWNTRAFNAWHKADFEGAARYWREAAQAKDATNAQVAQSLFNAGITLGQINRNEDEIAVYDEMVKRFGDAPEAVLREQVARALANKGITLGQINRNEDAIAVCDEVAKRFGDAPEAALREQVARALVNKGAALSQMNRSEDAIAVCDEAAKRFGDAPEAALREQVARALVNKGAMLGQINRNEDAIVVCDEVAKRFGDAPEAALREQVARALNGKGFNILCRAKQCWKDEVARKADLQSAATLFERAVEETTDKPMVWGNQAYAAFLLGQPDTSRSLLRQALQQGGEGLYTGTLGDLDIHPIPPDAEFRAMLEVLWAEVKAQGRV